MAIYLVNQGKTYKYECAGGYLWAPKVNKAGYQNKGYSLMQELRKGDYVIHNSGRMISAISVIQEGCKTAQQPNELKTGQKDYDWNDEGWIIKTNYFEFSNPISTGDLVEWARQNHREESAFQINGRLRLQYLCPLDPVHADYILDKAIKTEQIEIVLSVLRDAQSANNRAMVSSEESKIPKRRPKPWDEYEVAYLIEKYWAYKNKDLTKKQVIETISNDLREYAIKNNVVIDEKYRNSNGINMKIEELNYLFSHGEHGLKNTSDVFKAMVILYENNPDEFSNVLTEAHRRLFGNKVSEGLESKVCHPNIIKIRAKRIQKPDSNGSSLETQLKTVLFNNSGITIDAIVKSLSTFSRMEIEKELNKPVYICAAKKYYHKDQIELFDEMAQILASSLDKQFAKNDGYSSAKQLYIEARGRLDDFFFYNNSFDSQTEVYDLAKHLFQKEQVNGLCYIFYSNTHIWKQEPSYPKEYSGLLIDYARKHNGVFSRYEAEDYLESIGSASPAQTVSNVIMNTGSQRFLQYDENQFVLDEALSVTKGTISHITNQINLLLETDDYIAFGEIGEFFYETLPEVSNVVQWSPFLVEDFLRIHNLGFFTVRAFGDNKKTIPAALVREKAGYNTLGDVIFAEIEKDYQLPKTFTSNEFRELLLERGFIHGSEKYYSVHNMVPDDLRFYWSDNNTTVTVSF